VPAAKKSPCPEFRFLEQSAGSRCLHKPILNPDPSTGSLADL
jgi:hypothetical protein